MSVKNNMIIGDMQMKGLIRILLGTLILIGVAGSDCDGACIQNTMSLTYSVFWVLFGSAILMWGIYSHVEYQ